MIIHIEGKKAYTPHSKRLVRLGIGFKKGLKTFLNPVEVLFLVLKYDARVEINGKPAGTTDVFEWCVNSIENFMQLYSVYEDLRSRGYRVKVLDGFLVCKYVVLPFCERLKTTISEISKRRFEKLVLAIVDEENDVTYYKVEEIDLRGEHFEEGFEVEGVLIGDRVFTDPTLHKRYFYGGLKGNSTILSLLECAYLVEIGWLNVKLKGKVLSLEEIKEIGRKHDPNFDRKLEVYRDLKRRGFVVKTGLKFGSDFRLYDGRDVHSRYLLTIADNRLFPMYEIARAVRLAQSVRKKTVFVFKEGDRNTYVLIERVKL